MIVLDCNAALAMARGTVEGDAFRSLMLRGEEAIAPRFFGIESANALWKMVRAGMMTEDEASDSLKAATNLVSDFCPDDDLVVEAFSEAVRLNHPGYDMLYFVLARRNAATLFTLDRKLQQLCLDNGVDCVLTDTNF